MAYKTKNKKPHYIAEPYGLPQELDKKDKFKVEMFKDKEKSFVLSDKEKYEVMGRLNDRQLKAYSDLRFEGFNHKKSLEIAETL